MTEAEAASEGGNVMRYRRRPDVIEARQCARENEAALVRWVNESGGQCFATDAQLVIRHVDGGSEEASPGDWVIRDYRGDFHTCEARFFDQLYEPAT